LQHVRLVFIFICFVEDHVRVICIYLRILVFKNVGFNITKVTAYAGHTRRTKTKQIHNRICLGHQYTQASTNNAKKTWVYLQKTGGKDEPDIVFIPQKKKTKQKTKTK
jgi:hypothetical protein